MNADGVNEKSLCLVTSEKTQNDARLFCKENDMQLFNPASSPAAASTLTSFAKSVFGGKPKTIAVIARKGTTCQVVNGAGKISTTSCGTLAQFICEFQYESEIQFSKNLERKLR